MTGALLIFPCLALLCAPALWIVLGRPRILTLDSAQPSPPSSISVIIPARNEEINIGNLLSSINAQCTAPLEVIVVNDGSTDRTSMIAQDHGALVIDAKPLPQDWKGKPWACQQGVDAAKGSSYLFLDADTSLSKNAISILGALTKKSKKVYSICPYHKIKKPYEQLSSFFNVLMLAGSNAFKLKDANNPALFGQCMLISREHYLQSGGHAAVKDKVLENFHLSAILKEIGIERECYMGKGIVNMRMFPNGFGELWSSWQKGFSNGAANADPQALLWSSVWISGLMFCVVSLLLLLTPYTSPMYHWFTGATYLIIMSQCMWAFRWAGSFSIINALFFPITLIFYQILFFTSIVNGRLGKKSRWKGREVS